MYSILSTDTNIFCLRIWSTFPLFEVFKKIFYIYQLLAIYLHLHPGPNSTIFYLYDFGKIIQSSLANLPSL